MKGPLDDMLSKSSDLDYEILKSVKFNQNITKLINEQTYFAEKSDFKFESYLLQVQEVIKNLNSVLNKIDEERRVNLLFLFI